MWIVIFIDRYLHSTQETQKKDIRALSGIQTYDHSKWAFSNLILRTHGQRDRLWRDYRLSNELDKNCGLLGHYAASSSNILQMLRENLSVTSSLVKNHW
jgi:hypothetical protein